jgi:hypothetical protein
MCIGLNGERAGFCVIMKVCIFDYTQNSNEISTDIPSFSRYRNSMAIVQIFLDVNDSRKLKMAVEKPTAIIVIVIISQLLRQIPLLTNRSCGSATAAVTS